MLLFPVTLLASCDRCELNFVESQKPDKEVSMEAYDSIVISQRELIADFCIESQNENHTRVLSENCSFDSLKTQLLPTAEKFVEDLELTDEDINEIFEEEISTIEDKENAEVALLMFLPYWTVIRKIKV